MVRAAWVTLMKQAYFWRKWGGQIQCRRVLGMLGHRGVEPTATLWVRLAQARNLQYVPISYANRALHLRYFNLCDVQKRIYRVTQDKAEIRSNRSEVTIFQTYSRFQSWHTGITLRLHYKTNRLFRDIIAPCQDHEKHTHTKLLNAEASCTCM
jgi:hypothetical protein